MFERLADNARRTVMLAQEAVRWSGPFRVVIIDRVKEGSEVNHAAVMHNLHLGAVSGEAVLSETDVKDLRCM